MKTRKFNLKWQGLVLAMALCLVLVVFVASKAANPQVDGTVNPQVMQRAANLNDVWLKTNALEAKIAAMDERLIRIEQKIDGLNKDLSRFIKTQERMWQQENKK